MTRRGRKRRLVVEDEYWKLILDGVSTVEACRAVGIGRKTVESMDVVYGVLDGVRVVRAWETVTA